MTETVDPVRNDLWAPFWRGAEAGRLMLPWCEATGQAFWPPSAVSPFADGGAVTWREAAATGTLEARVTYRRGFQAAFKPLLPYGVGLVTLDAGPRLQAHIAEPDAEGSPQPGARVRIGFARLVEGGGPVPGVTEADA